MPQVSVIIPVYNAEKYVAVTIESVLSQKLSDFELLLINDGSTDGSLQILTKYARNDPRIRVIDKPNEGVSSTRNLGIREASAEYLSFVDADDVLSPDYLEVLHHLAVEHDADMVVCGYTTFHLSLTFQTLTPQITRVFHSTELIQTGALTSVCTKLIRKSILLCNGIEFPSGMTFGEDLFFCWKAFVASKVVYATNQPLYGYRLTGSGATMRFHPRLYEDYAKAFSDLRDFAASKGRANEIQEMDFFFTKRIPIFMMMTARQKSSLKEKLKQARTVLEDIVIERVLREEWDEFARFLSVNEESLYHNAREKKAFRVLMAGYKLDIRMKVSAVKGKLGGLHDS